MLCRMKKRKLKRNAECLPYWCEHSLPCSLKDWEVLQVKLFSYIENLRMMFVPPLNDIVIL